MKKALLCLLVGALLSAAPAGAKLKLPALIGDHMVLQKGSPVVWGWVDPGATVTVALGHNAQTTQADDQGKWKVSLNLPRSGGPYELTVSSEGESVTIQDVLVGEVWLGSGQSNMEFAMKTSSDAETQIPAAKFPKIRLFTVARVASFTPLDDVQGSWKVCSPDVIGDFSAVAYHFGKDLHKALRTPVGLIVAAWGGSAAEAWTPRSVLEKDDNFTTLVDQWDHNDSQIKTWKTGNDFEL
ncbi:MAG TPA: sialate O-acetylesterase, partial [bacterium]|nr:sialate O-acetylesterase [bacterium]